VAAGAAAPSSGTTPGTEAPSRTAVPDPPPSPGATSSLWRHADFLKLWTAETVSQFGSQITGLALPLAAILVLAADPIQLGLLNAMDALPFLLIGLPAGVWVDRLRRRPILIVADLGRAMLLASIPVAYLLDALSMLQLYVVGLTVGMLTVFFDVAYQSYLPALVDRPHPNRISTRPVSASAWCGRCARAWPTWWAIGCCATSPPAPV
jgi:MFS family permease